jgi:hypothetical protein
MDITCPHCGAQVPQRMNFKPFCMRCGWNLHRAELALAGKVSATKMLPIGIAVLLLLASFAMMRPASMAFFLIPLIFLSVLAIPAYSYFSTRKAIETARSTMIPSSALAQPPPDAALQQLQVLPRPRRVQFKIPKAILTVVALSALLMLGGLYLIAHPMQNVNARGKVKTSGNPSGILVVPVVFAVLVVIPYFRDKKKAVLMRDGELALAKVTYQENMSQGKSSYSRIGYEFKTISGQLIQDQAKDLTWTVYEDMTIPVFYDAQNPSNNVTPCSTYLKIVTNPF